MGSPLWLWRGTAGGGFETPPTAVRLSIAADPKTYDVWPMTYRLQSYEDPSAEGVILVEAPCEPKRRLITYAGEGRVVGVASVKGGGSADPAYTWHPGDPHLTLKRDQSCDRVEWAVSRSPHHLIANRAPYGEATAGHLLVGPPHGQ